MDRATAATIGSSNQERGSAKFKRYNMIQFNVSRILPTLLNHHPTLDSVRELSRRTNRPNPSTTPNRLLDVILRDIEGARFIARNSQTRPEGRQHHQGAPVLQTKRPATSNRTPTAHFPGQE